jgi:hypothetical protein
MQFAGRWQSIGTIKSLRTHLYSTGVIDGQWPRFKKMLRSQARVNVVEMLAGMLTWYTASALIWNELAGALKILLNTKPHSHRSPESHLANRVFFTS